MKIRLEHLPADVVGLSEVARMAAAAGPDFGPMPLPWRVKDLALPTDRHDVPQREELARLIKKGLEPFNPPRRTRTSLSVLAQDGVFCVISGQQPGLLCAPLYSLYKAIQACRLAQELSGTWGRPVVPIFWNHADDHDVAEVHHAQQLNRNYDLQKVSLAGLSSGRQPLSRIFLDEEQHRLSAVRSALDQMYGEHPYIAEALALFMPRQDESLANAMTRTLTELLGEHGLVVVEPDWIRPLASSALGEIVSCDVAGSLAQGVEEMRALGLDPGIDPAEAALVYRVDQDGRKPLRSRDGQYRYDGEQGSRTAAELAAEIVDNAPSWSAGALLRPLVQDAVFPTACYIGGWGELAYHAQLGPLRDSCGLPRTPFAPRISITLVDPDVRVALEKVGANLGDVLASRGQVQEEEVGAENSPAVIRALRETSENGLRALLAHKADLSQVDHALGVNLQRTASQMRGMVDKLLKKAERVHANSSGKGKRQARRLSNTLFPRDLPQERVLGPLAFTARFGRAWIEALYSELPPLSIEHIGAHLSLDEEETQASSPAP